MKLLIVLISIALEHLNDNVEAFRPFGWFRRLESGMHARIGRYPLWNGPLGVLGVLLAPLIGVWLVFEFFEMLGPVLMFLAGIVIVLLSLGPRDLSAQVEALLNALSVQDKTGADALIRELALDTDAEDGEPGVADAAQGVLVHANDRLFAVLVWFVILGPLGAALYRLSSELDDSDADRAPGFSSAAGDLHELLAWLPVRMLALGFALSGSLIHAMERWRFTDTLSRKDNQEVLIHSGLGALLIDDPASFCAEDDANAVELVSGVKGLIGRTLVVWLTVLALVTLAGWAG